MLKIFKITKNPHIDHIQTEMIAIKNYIKLAKISMIIMKKNNIMKKITFKIQNLRIEFKNYQLVKILLK